jgi:hypothetical protein
MLVYQRVCYPININCHHLKPTIPLGARLRWGDSSPIPTAWRLPGQRRRAAMGGPLNGFVGVPILRQPHILYHIISWWLILLYHIIISYYIIIHVLLTWQCENEWIQSKHKRGKSWVGPGPLTLVPETEFHTFSHACSLVATSELHPIGPIGSWAPRNNHDPPVWLRSRQRLNGSWAHFWPRNW